MTDTPDHQMFPAINLSDTPISIRFLNEATPDWHWEVTVDPQWVCPECGEPTRRFVPTDLSEKKPVPLDDRAYSICIYCSGYADRIIAQAVRCRALPEMVEHPALLLMLEILAGPRERWLTGVLPEGT